MKRTRLSLNPASCKLGLDPADEEKKNDLAFYEWIAGDDPDKTLGDFILHFLDDLKDETSEKIIRAILQDWRESCDPKEFQSRLSMLTKLMPARHPFHKIRKDFES
ncbi:hypothetical protein KKF59_01985 [Patescibacteria group bacterium]|nr:hypothetical protein [Patescibacteria group bacterium]MBU1034846.1 hypothetical protein [Patescibacteria group bacterium]MBU1629608.1 hypothetical protein [Patescibacteria group bacterium]MBU1907880.1 hypothetical protein [Patescibacteria group bacterium]